MNTYILLLRFVHIVSGAFWFGAAAFVALLLQPATAAAGPAGGQVMERLIKRGLPAVFTSASILSAASGLLLYLKIFGSIVPSTDATVQRGFFIGAVAGLLAFITVFSMHLPNGAKMDALQKELQSGNAPPSPEQMARMQAILRKMRVAALTTFVLLFIAISMMAVARYL